MSDLDRRRKDVDHFILAICILLAVFMFGALFFVWVVNACGMVG